MLLTLRKIEPQRKDVSACAIFGAIAYGKNGRAPEPMPASFAIRAICETEESRGGQFGNGLLLASPRNDVDGKKVSVWAKEPVFAETIAEILKKEGIALTEFLGQGNVDVARELTPDEGRIYTATAKARYFPLLCAVAKANAQFTLDEARIISFAHGMELYKGLASLSTLDRIYGLSGMTAEAMIAHTRYPTVAEPKAVRAHPKLYGPVGAVHNGDLTSYARNRDACLGKLAELYHRYTGKDPQVFFNNQLKSLVGTDSEMISVMLYTLMMIRDETDIQLSMRDILNVMIPRPENRMASLPRNSSERAMNDYLKREYAGFGMDGPVSCVVLINRKDSVDMLAIRDPNEYRPLQVVFDHERNRAFVASELRQIQAAIEMDNVFSRKVESYPLDPDGVLWVNSKVGVVWAGRKDRPYIVVPDISPDAIPLKGKPNAFAGKRIDTHVKTKGTAGIHSGFLSYGSGKWEHFGSTEANFAEASQLDTIVVHANMGTDALKAFQGRLALIRGSSDARAAAQLRSPPPHPSELVGMDVENPEHVRKLTDMLMRGRSPVVIMGETNGRDLGRINYNGIIMALNLDSLGNEGMNPSIVGGALMTGSLGGEAYIRGYVRDEDIGVPPSRDDVIEVCKNMEREGVISQTALERMREGSALNLDSLMRSIQESQNGAPLETNLKNLEEARERLSDLFSGSLIVERRPLAPDEKAKLEPYLQEFCTAFKLNDGTLEKVLASNYTIVKVKPTKETLEARKFWTEEILGKKMAIEATV